MKFHVCEGFVVPSSVLIHSSNFDEQSDNLEQLDFNAN